MFFSKTVLRRWRIQQKHSVRVVFFGYADTSRITCLQLMAKKITWLKARREMCLNQVSTLK